MSIKNLFSEKRKVMSQKSISDITGSATPVESSDYIDNYLVKKERFLPPINFATASNFAKFGSAKQYSEDAIKRVYSTYPYDGSLSEKISWLNSSNFYDLYIFNNRYPRTCGYAVFSPLEWGTATDTLNTFGKPDTVEYIQLKGGPHPDPSSGSLKLSRQFPTPYDGRANLYDNVTGVNRKSNLALDLDEGVTVEFWLKGAPTAAQATAVFSETGRQTAFDLWNGYTGNTEGNSYGRFLLSMTNSALEAHWGSGSATSTHTVDNSIFTTLSDGQWHHLAITAKQVPDASNYRIEWNDFLDGNWISKEVSSPYGTKYGAVTGSLIANIGAARIPARLQSEAAGSSVVTLITNGTNEGYGKLSGSIDEFRYWKTARTPQQINRFWNTQIGGGSNTDNMKFSGSAQPVDLGVYYKFNEGNVGNATIDSSVLDYSGRITNGVWTGYVEGSSRVSGDTASAMIQSSASVSEFRDPIIYSSHPDVVSLNELLSDEGEDWDLQNNMALYHTMPEWITSEDQDKGGEQLKKLTQIIASYLDTIYLQINAIPLLGDKKYPFEQVVEYSPDDIEGSVKTFDYKNSPSPFARNALEDSGMIAEEIFSMADELATLADRDENAEFEQKLYDIKNTIYQNIYNNITYIYKSKGTEKAYRNLIRCYGVDDELIKINLYVDNATYTFTDSDYRSTAVKDKYIDFNDADRNQSTIYQSASVSTPNSISYIPGYNPTNASSAGATGSAMTFEANVIFPKKFSRSHASNLWYDYPHLTSSIFGCHEAQPTVSSPEDFAWASNDSASFQVYAIRDIPESKDVRFMLTSSNGSIPTLTSSLFQGVYDNERWLFSVRVYPESDLEGMHVSGSGTDSVSGSWAIELNGYNALLDQVPNSFSVSASIPSEDGTYFMNANKRIYAGAHRVDFSGSLDKYSDIKVGSVRVWDDYLSDFELSVHAKDPTNFGRERAYKNSYLFNLNTPPEVETVPIPQFETLLLNWTFEDVTGSTDGAYLQDHYGGSDWNGSFEVLDYSSGSDNKWEVDSRYKHHYTGRGDWFLPSDSTSLVDLNFLSVVKTNLPEVSSGEDTISILTTDDDFFTRDSKPINHYFSFEKNMYQNISEEMLRLFATAIEFNNLVGEPVNRYRQEYKSLGKLREAFFRKVGNVPDFNRYVNFYKWIDASLSDMIAQLTPMSANVSDGIKTMVESHILERNKYWNKFPTLEIKDKPIVGRLRGINELQYDWKHGHSSYINTTYQTSKSVEFVSGSSHYIDFGDADHWTFGDESSDSPFSISCWIKFDDLDTANMPYYIMGKNSEYRILWGNSPETGGNQGLCFVVRDFTGSHWISQCITTAAFKTLVTEDTWHHLAFVYDGTGDSSSDISIYIDGVLWGGLDPAGTTGGQPNVQGAFDASYVAMHNTANEFQVGRLGGYHGDYFDGHIDELAMFTNALTAGEVSSLYNSGYPIDIVAEGIGTLAGYWALGDGDDTGANGIKDSSGNNRHGTVSGISSFSSDVFWSGPLPLTERIIENKNCLWWKERGEASASFVAGNQVDTDRNILRRVITSDITTNKILATGEYTDPVNYPNSGFPDAAEFNLAKDGVNLAARTQYKGSTYALRSFSKPYKLELEETVQLHGGINYHANKRRELTKHWTVMASPMGDYISLAPGYTDDLEDCVDVIDPSKKQFHSFAIDPGGSFAAGPAPEKGAHFAPFNFVSSSVTTNASLSETGIDIVNLHDDSYGDQNSRPMQGPFTERHVGGMAHRHQDISDTSHTSLNRTENFRITNLVKDVGFTVVAGDYRNYNTRDTNQPFDRFYRDGVAKRPVNIRNILTTTNTEMSQSALGNYEYAIQVLNTHNEGGTFLAKMQAATGSDGFYLVNSPTASLVIADTADTPKLLAFGKTLLDSSTPLMPPFTTAQFDPYISKNKITERFSAPGDPSTAGDAFGGFGIDREKNKYSVYNALPWRNRQVRFPTNALLSAHTGLYGSFSGSALNATDTTTAATASLHKTHRNTDYVVRYVDDNVGDAGTTYCAQRFDNYYVQHPIPANDFGYAWITASADHSNGCELLTTASFITGSDNGSYVVKFASAQYGRIFGLATVPASALGVGAWNTLTQFIPSDFAGLNSIIYEPVDSSLNELGYESLTVTNTSGGTGAKDVNYVNDDFNDTDGAGGTDDTATSTDAGGTLNAIILNRQGPYGHPSWKQTRGGQHPIVREHKKHNILSLTQDLEIPDHLNPDKRARARIITNIKQTPITLDYPMVHKVNTVSNGLPQSLTLKHTYANNLVMFTHPTIAGKLARPLSEKPRQMYDEIKDQYLGGMYDSDSGFGMLKAFKTLVYKQTLYPKTENMYLSGSRGRISYAETAAYISQSKNGEYETFWRDNLSDRRREDGALNSLGYPIHASFNQATSGGVDQVSKLVIGEGTLSVWPLDVGVGNSDHASSVADDKYYLKGLYTFEGSPAVVPSSDEYGGTWGELHRDTIGTLFGSLTTAQLRDLNGLDVHPSASTFHHFMGDHHFITHPTASQCFNHYQLSGIVRTNIIDIHTHYPIVGGVSSSAGYLGTGPRGPTPANWKTHTWSGRAPWYDSYEDYSSDIRSMGQEYTVIPEFKISDHMDYYIEQGNFEEENFKFLSLPGAPVTASAETEDSGYNEVFWKEYAHSDFMEHFEMVQADHSEFANMSVIELKCSAVKKLLPYDGFYPVQRCLQLGALMSSSYAPFLWGSSEATYGPTSDTNENLKFEAERLQSFLQPFYAPGIMYNTVKSGIAVDYPIHTSQAEVHFAGNSTQLGTNKSTASGSFHYGQVNSASGSQHVVMSAPDYRMPFEALVNPDAFLPTTDPESFTFDSADLNLKKMYLTAPYYGSSSFYAQWQGASKPNYRLAINNFCAEVPNFFLKNKTLTTFRSKRQSEFKEFKSGSTYYMDVVLQKTPDMIMNHHFGVGSFGIMGGVAASAFTSTGWGFGPSYQVTGTIFDDGHGRSILGVPALGVGDHEFYSNFGDPTYAVHAPPYYYGRAVARLAFAPHEAMEMEEGQVAPFSLFNILENVKVCPETEYFKEVGVGQLDLHTASYGNLVRNLEDSLRYPAKEHQMHISSSVNLFGSTFLPDIDFEADTKRPLAGKLLKNPANSAWVMHSKWETPVLNFANGTGGGLGPGETVADLTADLTGSWWNAPQYPKALQRPLGMWNGYGSHPTGETGITLSLKESYPDKIGALNTTLTGSLIDNCGFQAEQRKIGELANHKWISEAVVAIPFVDVAGERKFFSLGENFAHSKMIFNQALAGEDGPGRSIIQLAEKMPRYVFPPHMDFVNNSTVEPFVMYIFEFSHKLTQKDLSNIWQNVMPDIGVTAEKTTSSLQHLTGKNEFFRGEKLPHNTRWMVFKVKQRSATNYFKMTQDSKDDHNFKFDFEGGGSAETYNYNWPYDFFSLVELAKIDSKIGIGDEAFEIRPLTSPKFGSNIVNEAVPDPPGPTNTAMDDFTYGQLLSDQVFEVDTGVQAQVQNSKLIASSQLGKTSTDNSMMKMMKKLSGGSATQQDFPTNDPNF